MGGASQGTDDQIKVAASSIEDLARLGAAYRNGDRKIRTKINRALKGVALPMVPEILEEAAQGMPHRGGLSERIAGSQGSVLPSLRGGNPAVSLRFKSAQGTPVSLRDIEAGSLRHPVFGHRDRWVSQEVPSGRFRAAFEKRAPAVRAPIEAAMQQALNEIGAEA